MPGANARLLGALMRDRYCIGQQGKISDEIPIEISMFSFKETLLKLLSLD